MMDCGVTASDRQLSACDLWRLASAMAWLDLDQQYKRAALGKNWIALTFLLFVGINVFIFGALNGVLLEFFAPYLALGYLVYRTISHGVKGGARVFLASGKWIKTETLPLLLYLISFMAKIMIQFAYMTVPALAICILFGAITWQGAASTPFAILAYSLNINWAAGLLGILAARYRDLVHILTTVMHILYFATQILWVPTETGIRPWMALYNPFTHCIAILREPFMTGNIPWRNWAAVAGCTVMGSCISLIFYRRHADRLVYWI